MAAGTSAHDTPPAARRFRTCCAWLFGAVLLTTVIIAALHYSEAQAFVQLAENAQPAWLMLALALQFSTYVCEGAIWRLVVTGAGRVLSGADALRLSLVKLFLDQAVPSAGLSGTVAVAHALARLAIGPGAIAAGVVVGLVSYYAAYMVTLAAALVIAVHYGAGNPVLVGLALLFIVYALVSSTLALALSGRRASPSGRRHLRYGPLRKALDLLEHVDPALARSPRLLVYASALQLAIIGLDVATMAAMLHALGASIAPAGVFASVVLANLFRSIGILPGGLGSFEAAAVLTLKAFGVPLATALAATLLFRGFSFWLPMLPGLWCSQRMFTAVPRGPMITHAWPASRPGCDKPMAPL